MWILGGDVGRAADSLVKAASMVEDANVTKAVEYCLQVGCRGVVLLFMCLYMCVWMSV